MPARAKVEARQRAGFWREFREGVQFFVGSRVLVTLLISGMIFMFAGMAYNPFEYLYGSENLHLPGELLGLYVAAMGVGVVAGLPLAALAKRRSEVEVLWTFLVGYGLTMLALSRVTTLLPGRICGVLLGILQSSVFVAVRPLTVLVIPRKLIGRVMAFESPLGGALASALAATVLANFHATVAGISFGRLDTIFVGIGALTIGAGVFARLALYPAVNAMRAKQAQEAAATAAR